MSRALAFIPLHKVDEEKRLVYGLAAEEILDKSGEIMDYETSVPHFRKWSEDISNATGGASLGNLRSMHQPVAAGKLTAIDFDDESRQILICAKVVDDGEWNKVLEGVYTGFSMGGSYAKKWKDGTVIRYTAAPSEISLVDNPCVPTAHFEVMKANGLTEMRKFTLKEQRMDPTNEEIAARATEMAKAAGDETKWSDFMDAARADLTKSAPEPEPEPEPEPATSEEPASAEGTEAEAAEEGAEAEPALETAAEPEPVTEEVAKTMVSQVWQSPDGTTHLSKAAAVAHVMNPPAEPPAPAPEPPLNPVEAALKAARSALEGGVVEHPLAKTHALVTKTHADLLAAHAAWEASGVVEKSFWNVAQIGDVLRDLGYATSEAAWCAEDRDHSTDVPAKLFDALQLVCDALCIQAQEEIAEIMQRLKNHGIEVGAIEGVEKTVVDTLAKFVAPADVLAKVTTRLAAPAPDEADGEVMEKMVSESPLFKALQTKNEELEGQVKAAVEGIADLTKRFEALGKQPAPMAPRTSVVEKAAKVGDEPTISLEAAQAAVAELSKTVEGQRMLADAAIKGAVPIGRM